MTKTLKRAFCLLLAAVLFCMPVAVAADDTENYYTTWEYMSVGAAEYAMYEGYEYTVYSFSPSETGKYTFTADNGLMGIISYNGMWATVQPSDTTITESTISWECTGVGQEIWIAVKCADATASINITRGDSEIKVIEKIIYENKTTPAPFTYEGVVDDLLSVNTLNSTVDTAVLGADGYYHLNSADGYILYANLSDAQMSLYSVSQTGQLKGAVYEDEELVAIVDYNIAFLEYYECVDTATYLYPLTDDLIEMFREIGANMGWYGADGWIGGTRDDAWMFACYYSEVAVAETYTVSVNGVESQVAAGTVINISADAFYAESAAYYRFSGWEGDIDGIADATAAETTLTVNGNVTITAGYLRIGDITSDGKINSTDSNMIKRIAAGKEALVPAADLNNDGKINSTDSYLLANLITGNYIPAE